mmetsp:Transcript_6214/g.11740  ORF Transcript_6214/g.11740 Transcript_6214/m.11740 type:complete len:81 (-) Transcript_6214:608-850(-)
MRNGTTNIIKDILYFENVTQYFFMFCWMVLFFLEPSIDTIILKMTKNNLGKIIKQMIHVERPSWFDISFHTPKRKSYLIT